jgi:hypothetical protein
MGAQAAFQKITINWAQLSAATLPEAIHDLKLEPDFSFSKSKSDENLSFAHGRLPDGDIYFVCKSKSQGVRAEAHFRVTGRAPVLWHADSGKVELSLFWDGRQSGRSAS